MKVCDEEVCDNVVKNCIIVYCESLWWSCDEVVLKSVIKNEIKKLQWITILHTMLWCGWNEVVRVYWRSVTIIVEEFVEMCSWRVRWRSVTIIVEEFVEMKLW